MPRKRKTSARSRGLAPAYVPPPGEDVPLTIPEACVFFGGPGRPISLATYYRGANRGTYPKPFNPSPGISRVMKSACESARAALAAKSESA
jgi:hypothetical protein